MRPPASGSKYDQWVRGWSGRTGPVPRPPGRGLCRQHGLQSRSDRARDHGPRPGRTVPASAATAASTAMVMSDREAVAVELLRGQADGQEVGDEEGAATTATMAVRRRVGRARPTAMPATAAPISRTRRGPQGDHIQVVERARDCRWSFPGRTSGGRSSPSRAESTSGLQLTDRIHPEGRPEQDEGRRPAPTAKAKPPTAHEPRRSEGSSPSRSIRP